MFTSIICHLEHDPSVSCLYLLSKISAYLSHGHELTTLKAEPSGKENSVSGRVIAFTKVEGGVRSEKSLGSGAPSLLPAFHLPSLITDLAELPQCSCLDPLGGTKGLWRLQLWLV